MAKNLVLPGVDDNLSTLSLTCTHPAVPVSGDPVRFGAFITGTATSNEGADGKTVVDVRPAVYRHLVHGHNGTAGAAINAGDKIYYNDADTPKLNVRTAGIYFGIALEPVGSGVQATIDVLQVPFK